MDLKEAARAAARRNGIPEELFLGLVQQESGFRPDAVSSAGAIGPAQLMPGTARELGVDPRDPIQNLEGGARYLSQQLKAFGTPELALAAYNAGPGAVLGAGGVPNFPETQAYIPKVLGYAKQFAGGGGSSPQQLPGGSTPAPVATSQTQLTGQLDAGLMDAVFGGRRQATPGDVAGAIAGSSFASAVFGLPAQGVPNREYMQSNPGQPFAAGPIREIAAASGIPPEALQSAGLLPLGGATTSWTRDPDAEQTGYDFQKPGGIGAPIVSPVDLKITDKGFQGQGSGESGRGYGNWVTGEFTGDDGRRYELLLGHLNDYNVRPGQKIPKGFKIGTQGITGRATGPHVTTHVNALQGGDPWAQLNRIGKLWTRPLNS